MIYDGIKFEWGGDKVATGLDCYGLASHVRCRETGGRERLRSMPWIYNKFSSLEKAPKNIVREISEEVATPVLMPCALDLILITNRDGLICLGTYLLEDRIVGMSPSGSFDTSLSRLAKAIAQIEFVRPRKKLVILTPARNGFFLGQP